MLSARDITIWLSGRKILDNIGFEIDRGECVGLIGTSGSGKTTLINAMLGFHRIDKGTLKLNGKDITNNQKELRKIANMATQQGAFYPKLTVQENFVYFAELYGMQPDNALARMRLITQFLEISQYLEFRAESLSGGTQKRFEIGLAIINRPKLLLLDEPASGLDVILRNEIYDIVRRINKMGTTVILASHDLNILQRYVTSIIIMDRGVISRKIMINEIKDLEKFFKDYKGGIMK